MDSRFFSDNRASLMRLLGDTLVVLPSYAKLQGQGDAAHPFKQEANFWYLSGVVSADSLLVIDGKKNETWLLLPELDEVHQLFDGSLDYTSAAKISGVDKVASMKDSPGLLQRLSLQHDTVYTLGTPPYARHADFVLNPTQKSLKRKLTKLFTDVKDCRKELARLRAIKQPVEIELMKRAAMVSCEAFATAKQRLAEYSYEYELEAELSYYFRRNNFLHAFEPIVASGKNACTLHYTANSDALKPGQLLLIDAGAALDGYPTDITRTYAVGEPTQRQRTVHAAVREAEKSIIKLLRPGRLLKEYSAMANEIMQESLLSLGLVQHKKDQTNFRNYFPHAISHGLGIEVHESLGGYDKLLPGMTLTVEPGVYISGEGIGVRIEDTILITETGHTNLTSSLSTDL